MEDGFSESYQARYKAAAESSPASSSASNRAKGDIGRRKEGKKGRAYIVCRHGRPFPGLVRHEDGSVEFFQIGDGVPKAEALEDLLIMSRLPDDAFVEVTAEDLKRMRKKAEMHGKTRQKAGARRFQR